VSQKATIARILAPTDFSPFAEVACTLAARLANRLDAALVLFHAVPIPDMTRHIGGAKGRTREAVLSASGVSVREWFEAVVPKECWGFLAIEVQVTVGEPALEIASVAAASRAELIVMGTHGRSGIGHRPVGSVTESVLRAAAVPVLALRRGHLRVPLTEVRRILWATDLSPTSEGAFRYALALADALSAEVFLFHVVDSGEVAEHAEAPTSPPRDRLEPERAGLDRELGRREEQVAALGVRARRKVVIGVPAERILAEARAERADLIVMGTRAPTGPSHSLLGSVAKTVIRKAPCPVLVVRERGWGRPEESGPARAWALAGGAGGGRGPAG